MRWPSVTELVIPIGSCRRSLTMKSKPSPQTFPRSCIFPAFLILTRSGRSGPEARASMCISPWRRFWTIPRWTSFWWRSPIIFTQRSPLRLCRPASMYFARNPLHPLPLSWRRSCGFPGRPGRFFTPGRTGDGTLIIWWSKKSMTSSWPASLSAWKTESAAAVRTAPSDGAAKSVMAAA